MKRSHCRAQTGGWRTQNSLYLAWLAATLCAVAGCAPAPAPPPPVTAPATTRVSAVPPRPDTVAAAVPPAAASAAAVPAPDTSPPPDAAPLPPPATPPEQTPGDKPRSIVGQTTQKVRDAATEQAAGAKKVTPRITGKDPITVAGNAYVSIIGRTEILQIQHSVDLFYNLNGRYPKDINEFMKEIIKANNIKLARLPPYQEYGYDAATHQLVILEYPDRKKN